MFVRVKKVGTYRHLQIAQNRREGNRVASSVPKMRGNGRSEDVIFFAS